MGSAAAEGSGQWAVHAVVLSVKGCGVSALVVQLCIVYFAMFVQFVRLCSKVCAVSKSWKVVEHPFTVASMCSQCAGGVALQCTPFCSAVGSATFVQ